MSDEQQLNSLERFRKQPGRLVLEEHSHCEVPAGCGGVVLRWRNPLAGLPVTLDVYTPKEAGIFLDGETPTTSRVDLVPGRHVVAMRIKKVDLSLGLLMFAATHEAKELQSVLPREVREPSVRILSAADGTWKYTLKTPPGDEWKSLAFDDSGWSTLVAVAAPELDWEADGAYAASHCADHGAACLALPMAQRAARTGSVWIRKVFEIAPPEILPPPS